MGNKQNVALERTKRVIKDGISTGPADDTRLKRGARQNVERKDSNFGKLVKEVRTEHDMFQETTLRKKKASSDPTRAKTPSQRRGHGL
jgi:hypothetical protein